MRAFAYKQAVRGLEAGSLYKAQVDFRWYDAAGRLVGTSLRRSPPCRQFDLLPNLTAKPFAVRSLKPGELYRYRIVLTNEGVTAATGVPVRLTVNGTVVDTVVVPSLPPAARKVVVIDGPRVRQLGEGRGRSRRADRGVGGGRQRPRARLRRLARPLRRAARAPIPSVT